jgi:hypothetical protein
MRKQEVTVIRPCTFDCLYSGSIRHLVTHHLPITGSLEQLDDWDIWAMVTKTLTQSSADHELLAESGHEVCLFQIYTDNY